MLGPSDTLSSSDKLFEDIKKEILKIDPVSFAENYLMVDGKPLKLSNTGWKFLADIYRYVAVKALEPDGKPVVCVKGRQVGATTMAAALELYFTTSGLFGTSPDKPPIKILHCFPALAQVQNFAKDRLSTMMRTSREDYVLKQALGYYDDKSGKRRVDVPDDTLMHKQFKYENRLWIDSNANDATRLQGMSVDAIFYDEVQHMHQDDIGNSNRTLTAAKYGPKGNGIQLYFGTPLQKGSYFYKMWEASDQRYYHLRCEACQEYFRLYTLGTDDWEKIWLYDNVVECPKCKHHQDRLLAIENGKWLPTKFKMDNGEEPVYVGFHFNQLLIPYFVKETVLREKPGVHPTNSDRVWMNEILGEFYSGSDLPMSEGEIRQYCRDPNRKISAYFPKSSSSNTFMGIDWGGKADNPGKTGGKSYSSIVVISVDNTDTIRIENAFKLKKNTIDHKKEVVAEMYRRYNIKVSVADLGYGNDIVPELQREYSSRLLGCLNSGSLINPYKYDVDDMRLICNHNTVLDDIFKLMRRSKVLFPWQSFELIQWLIEHCCSMEKEDRISQGQVITRYVKGNGPNDGLMALMYAYLAYKFYQTKGFNLKPHLQGSKIGRGPTLAFLPKV